MEQLPVDPRVEIAIALAGPAANFALVSALLPITILLGVASGFASPADYALSVFQPSLAGLATTLLYANLLIIVSNLVPAFPMDGGRVLRASLSTMWGREAATRMAMVLGELLAILLLIFAVFVLQSVIVALLALFVMVVAYAEDRAVRVESALRRMRVGQFALWDMGGISPEQPLAYALRGGPRDLAVTKGGRVVGMLWRNQVLAELSRAPSTKTVGEVMEPNVAVVDADTTVFDVQLMMIEQDRWAVPVTESGLYRGLFTGDRVLHIYRQLSPDPLSMIKAFLNRGPLAGLRT
jgi:hypothetical protein